MSLREIDTLWQQQAGYHTRERKNKGENNCNSAFICKNKNNVGMRALRDWNVLCLIYIWCGAWGFRGVCGGSRGLTQLAQDCSAWMVEQKGDFCLTCLQYLVWWYMRHTQAQVRESWPIRWMSFSFWSSIKTLCTVSPSAAPSKK